MAILKKPNPEIWKGRKSDQQLYLHEKVAFEAIASNVENTMAILGYACDEGVKRNQGRKGALSGPDAIRTQLAKMPNHLDAEMKFVDHGTIECSNGDMEAAQNLLKHEVSLLLAHKVFPILIGGGHEIAYGHYNGISKYIGTNETIGIINFDAHFDLRTNENGNNSGTPFFQIAEDCKENGSSFNYLCLGIRKDANDKNLFETAHELNVDYLENNKFSMDHAKSIVRKVLDFIQKVDHIYVTIDLDGFSSAYAPGVSAPSPIGFTPTIVLETLEVLIKSNKLISIDIAEMNPKYDIDNQTAKLAASLIHHIMHSIAPIYSNQDW
ncbi:MAG: formimidoylglutamase [Maribacter sp.]|nr:formimidoylglutamase [Maribacter sp.]